MLGIVALGFVCGAGAYVLSSNQEPIYSSTGLIQLVPSQQAAGVFISQDVVLQLTNQYAQLATSSRVLNDAAPGARVSPTELERSVTVGSEGAGILNVTSTASSPEAARRQANAVIAGLIRQVEETQRRVRTDQLQPIRERARVITSRLKDLRRTSSLRAALLGELQSLQARSAELVSQPVDSVRILRAPSEPSSPSSPRPRRDALIVLVVTLLLAALIALAWIALGDRYQSAEEASSDLDLPLLGALPKAALYSRESVEAMGLVRAALGARLSAEGPLSRGTRTDNQASEQGRRIVLVTSDTKSVGKTYVTAGLATTVAIDGRRVLAIDGDLRAPALGRTLGAADGPGLAEALEAGRTDVSVEPVSVRVEGSQRGDTDDLFLMPAGTPTSAAAELVGRTEMAQILGTAAPDYEWTIIDSPPVTLVADALVLSRYVTGVVVVVDAKRSSRRSSRKAVELLRSVDAPVLGILFNRAGRHRSYRTYGRH